MPQLIETVADFNTTITDVNLVVVHFAADWVEQCKQVDEVLDLLSQQTDYSKVKFTKCKAEDLSEISFKYQIEAAPTVLFFKNNKKVDRVDGADPAKITAKVKEHAGASTGDKNSLEDRLKALVNKAPVMLFMKGDRNTPRCGFSRQIIEIINGLSINYETFDILTDEEVRQGLKTFSDWPTYPQLYVKGELLGGLDIIKEMLAAGELSDALKG